MALHACFGVCNNGPTPNFCTPRKDGAGDFEYGHLKPGPFSHYLRVTPSRIHAVDNNVVTLGAALDEIGELACGEDAEKFGDIVTVHCR